MKFSGGEIELEIAMNLIFPLWVSSMILSSDNFNASVILLSDFSISKHADCGEMETQPHENVITSIK